MARCPFATQKPITGGLGNYSPGSRFKIVHHTTEGSTAAGAMALLGSELFLLSLKQLKMNKETGKVVSHP